MKWDHFLTVVAIMLALALLTVATIFARNVPMQLNPAESREP